MHKLVLLIGSFFFLSDIYQFSLPAAGGGPDIDFKQFRGKRVLVVNTASHNVFMDQFAGLEQLRQQFQDSLVIVVVPSNDFGNEPKDNAAIDRLVKDTYHGQYLVAGKSVVSGDNRSPLYKWLTTGGENGGMSSTVTGDFQKYLIGRDGHVIGWFIGGVSPVDSTLLKLIREN